MATEAAAVVVGAGEEGEEEELEPTIANILEQRSLRWVFVGGKGGVGKTTTSCSLAVQLARVRESVLVISTDPAHNLSDAFGQKFGSSPVPVRGFDNLSCMEVDPSKFDVGDSLLGSMGGGGAAGAGAEGGAGGEEQMGLISKLQGMVSNFPGVDEAMSFAELMKLVQTMDFSVIVFDTAPTGHTLKLLQFPNMLKQLIEKFSSLSDGMASFMPMIQSMFGAGGADALGQAQIGQKMQEMKQLVDKVIEQFRDPSMTTFVCVCIPEFLSIFETERLVQELSKFGIDTHNVVVNQVLFPDKDFEDMSAWFDRTRSTLPEEAQNVIAATLARKRMQENYISQVFDLYDTFHIVLLPQLQREVRGVAQLEDFSRYLMETPEDLLFHEAEEDLGPPLEDSESGDSKTANR